MLSRDEQRLEHILEYCKDIAQTTERFGNEYVVFHADKAYHDLIFYLLQIGELSGQLSEELRSISYDDTHAWVESYADGCNPIVSDEAYVGTGSLYMQNGKIHWYNDVTGQLTVLFPA